MYITIENHHFSWGNPRWMAIFNSYVKLPEGRYLHTMAVDMFVHVNVNVLMPFWPPSSWTEGRNKGNVLHKNDHVIRRPWMFCPRSIVAFLGTSLPHANGIEMCPKRNLLDLSGLSKFLGNPQSITSCHIVDSRTCGAKWRRCGAFHTFGISWVKRITSTIHVVAELPRSF